MTTILVWLLPGWVAVAFGAGFIWSVTVGIGCLLYKRRVRRRNEGHNA